MSFPMDEIGLSNIVQTAQANITTTGNVTSLSTPQSSTDQSVAQNMDVSDTLNLSNNVSGNNQNNNSLQQAGSMIDTANTGLFSISGYLNDIKQQIQTIDKGNVSSTDLSNLETSIKQDLSGIENTAKNTSFNNTNLLDGSNTKDTTVNVDGNNVNINSKLGNNTLAGLGLPSADKVSLDNTQDIQALANQVDQASQSVANQQSILEETKDKIIKAVGSLVVIGQDPDQTATYNIINTQHHQNYITKYRFSFSIAK